MPQTDRSMMYSYPYHHRTIKSSKSMTKRKDILAMHGYTKQNITIAPTLQGSAFVARRDTKDREILLIHGFIRTLSSNHIHLSLFIDICTDVCHNYVGKSPIIDVVIKSSNKTLYRQGYALNREFVNDDIVKEAQLMKLFMNSNAPSSIIRYYDFLEDEDSYYLIMERGGSGLFEFVVKCILENVIVTA